MMSGRPIVNPYARKNHNNGPHNGEMGRQSQQRNSQQKRGFALASKNNPPRKNKKGDQQTLVGGIAFDAEKDCVMCRAYARRRFLGNSVTIPHRQHHKLCPSDRKTRGQGELHQQTLAAAAEEKRLAKCTMLKASVSIDRECKL